MAVTSSIKAESLSSSCPKCLRVEEALRRRLREGRALTAWKPTVPGGVSHSDIAMLEYRGRTAKPSTARAGCGAGRRARELMGRGGG